MTSINIPVNILGYWAIATTITTMVLALILILMPRPARKLLSMRFKKKTIPALICDETGLCDIEGVKRSPEGLVGKIGKNEITYYNVKSNDEEIDKKRFVLEGLWRPFFIIYRNKLVAATPEQLKAILLDPREMKKHIKININPATLIWTTRNAKAAGFIEAKSVTKQSIMYALIIIAFFIGAAIFYKMVVSPEQGLSVEQIKQIVQSLQQVKTINTTTVIPG